MVANTMHSESSREETESKPNESRRQFLEVIGGASAGIAGMTSPVGAERNKVKKNNLAFVEDGDSNGIILWWSSDTESVASFAASELQSYIAEISGADIPIQRAEVTDSSQVANAASGLVVLTDGETNRYCASNGEGQSKLPVGWIQPADKALAETEPDSFAIRTMGGRMMFAGTTHRGTLYSAYEFLERLGVRFFAPDFEFYENNSEHVPDRSTVTVPELEIIEEPDMAYRRKYIEEGWSHTDQNLPKLIDWMAKNRHNILVYPTDYSNYGVANAQWDTWREELIPELKKRGMKLETGGHGFDSFLDPDEYADEHPEWFVDGYNVFNIANEQAVQTYIDEVVAYLEERPEIGIFDAWPPDGADWPPSVVEAFDGIANAYSHVVNQLKNALDEHLSREVEVEAIAYASHVLPPDSEHMFNESIIVDFAPWDRSYATTIDVTDEESVPSNINPSVDPIGTPDNIESYVELIELWTEEFDGDIAFYEYYRKYLWHSLPVALPDLISYEIPYFDSIGINGIGIYSEPADWIPYELNHLLVARLSWDTDLDGAAYVGDYLQYRFGPAASEMETYFELMEATGRMVWDGTRDNMNDLDIISDVRDKYLQARDVLAAAKTDADPVNESLIESLALNLEFAIARTEIDYYDLLGEDAKHEQANQQTIDLIDAHRFDGIILKSTWTSRHVEGRDFSHDSDEIREMYRNEWDG